MKQNTGLKRNIIDKYYTKETVVNKYISIIKNTINIGENDLCIEPSAGNGAFIKGIKSISKNNIYYDIEPEGDNIIKQDYLILDTNIFKKYDKIHVIGNPPFGRQSSMAIKFIKKSCIFVDSLSFVLPKSFKKDSLQKHFPINFHLIYEEELSKDSFTINNDIYDVPCVFQVWIKRDVDRVLPIKLKPKDFKFVKKGDNPDISFRRVGVNAGIIDKNIEGKSEQSHNFIKFNGRLSDEKFKKLNDINYKSRDDTVGPRSISKQEIIKEFNNIL